MRKLLLLIILLALYNCAYATIIYVPSDSSTIQSAIDGSIENDTIIILPGIYSEQLNIIDKNIVLASNYLLSNNRDDISNTILDGDSLNQILFIEQCEDSMLSIIGFTFSHGKDYDNGGAVYIDYSTLSFRDCIFLNNTAQYGGAIYFNRTTANIGNCLFVNNHAIRSGGGIYQERSSIAFQSCIFYYNTADFSGGGLASSGDSLSIKNSIIWGNYATKFPAISGSYNEVSYSIIPGEWSGNSNIDQDPLFMEMPHINPNVCSESPCIDNGDPSMTDPDGSRLDIGLYFASHPECTLGNKWYVSKTGSDLTGNGTSEAPFKSIQYAIDYAYTGDTILVDSGIYFESIRLFGKNVVLTSNYIENLDSMYIQTTVIDGSSENCVVRIVDCDTTSKLIGFMFRNGYTDIEYEAAGINCINTEIGIHNNVITNNYSSDGAGGLKLWGSNLVITDSKILKNEGDYNGSAIHIDNHSTMKSINNLIAFNQAHTNGHAINCYDGSSFELLGNTISRNGPMHPINISYSGICTIRNSIVWGNYSTECIKVFHSDSLVVEYSNIQYGWEGAGNISNPPYFITPDNYDFNLCSESICIDAGDPSINDPDGSRSDMGIYFENHPLCNLGSVWYVSPEGNDSLGSGTEANPLKTIQMAVDLAHYSDTIIVDTGLYVENIEMMDKNISLFSHYYFSKDSSDIISTIIDGNSQGNAIRIRYSDYNSEISGFSLINGLAEEGAGLSCSHSNLYLEGCRIYNNVAPEEYSYGGGICIRSSNAILTKLRIFDNSAVYRGGGVSAYNSNVDFSNCLIYGNTSEQGAGIYVDEANISIDELGLFNNTALYYGGGLYCGRWSEVNISSSTIAGNNVVYLNGDYGGGIYLSRTEFNALNSIISNNMPDDLEVYSENDPVPQLSYCNIDDEWSGEGNISDDPLFYDLCIGLDICLQSPCIDAGHPDSVDIDGTRKDIGLFFSTHPECEIGRIWYVSNAGNDEDGDGSQEYPYGTIQHAYNNTHKSDTIIVLPGNYSENVSIGPHEVILTSNFIYSNDSADILNTIVQSGKGGSVFTVSNCDSSAILNGLTIKNGRADEGGGIYCTNSDIKIINNIITDNEAEYAYGYGAGIYCINSNPLISSNYIYNNYSGNYGGAISLDNSDPLIMSNIIDSNRARDQGGGIYAGSGSNPYIQNNMLVNNKAGSGAAIFLAKSSASIHNNRFMDNISTGYSSLHGAVIHSYNSDLQITYNTMIRNGNMNSGEYSAMYFKNCNSLITNNTIADNIQREESIAIGGLSFGEGEAYIANCILWNNTSDNTAEIVNENAVLNISCCDVMNWTGEDSNFALDPLFCDQENRDYSLASNSPCLPSNNSCEALIGALDQGCSVTSVEEINQGYEVPSSYCLYANYPNPFNPETRIEFELPKASHVELSIYNVLGQKITTIADDEYPAGRYRATWDGTDSNGNRVASGIYLYQLKVGDFVESRKMLLIK